MEEVGTPKQQEGTPYPRCALAHPRWQHMGCAQRLGALPKHIPSPNVWCGWPRGAACDAGTRQQGARGQQFCLRDV